LREDTLTAPTFWSRYSGGQLLSVLIFGVSSSSRSLSPSEFDVRSVLQSVDWKAVWNIKSYLESSSEGYCSRTAERVVAFCSNGASSQIEWPKSW
jgi:hypothetical protein